MIEQELGFGDSLPGSNVETLNLQAGDLDGDDALEDKVEVDGGSRGNLLQQGDLHLQGDRGAVLHQDREGSHFKHVKGDRFGAAVCNIKYYEEILLCCLLLE